MNYVLIFKNDAGLRRISGFKIEDIPKNPVKIGSNTEVYLYDDYKSLEEVSKEFKEKRKNKENTFYVVLHFTKQNDLKADFVKFFGQNVITQKHVSNSFYFTILPKLKNSRIGFKEIEAYFPIFETELKLLHKLRIGNYNLNKNEEELIEQFNFPLADFQKKFGFNLNNESLKNFRNQLIK